MLAGCGTHSDAPRPTGPVPGVVDNAVGGSCVLYARAASGIDIMGDASAGGISRPDDISGQHAGGGRGAGAGPDRGLRLGHLAVVREVIDPRDILVDSSNWVPGRVITGMQVQDVSPEKRLD